MIGSSKQPARYRPIARPVTQTRSIYSRNVRMAQLLTAAIILLAAVASAGGLLIPGLYRNPAPIVPAMQGQDAITLLVLPILSVALLATKAWVGARNPGLDRAAGLRVVYLHGSSVRILLQCLSSALYSPVLHTSLDRGAVHGAA